MKIGSRLSLFLCVFTYIILLVGGIFVTQGKLTIGELIAFLQYSSRFSSPIVGLVDIPMQLSRGYAAVSNVSEVLAKKNSGSAENHSRKVVDTINVSFEKNTVSYIVGKSGSGKTTLANLIMGRLKTNQPNVWYDNQEVADMGIRGLVDTVAWVSQEAVLFNDTVEKNIILDRCLNQKRLEEICSDCEILKEIENKPEGFKTFIQEKGNDLSGGQKSRIALARALYMDKPVIIIDEVTSGLDLLTEERIRENIKVYFRDKIVIIITHSSEFILDCGNVYRLEEGKLEYSKRGEVC